MQKFTGDVVINARSDRRVLAAIAAYYEKYAGPDMPITRGRLISQALEDFALVLESNGKTIIPGDVREATQILVEIYGPSKQLNAGGKGARKYLENLRQAERWTEQTGELPPLLQEAEKQKAEIEHELNVRAQSAGFENWKQWQQAIEDGWEKGMNADEFLEPKIEHKQPSAAELVAQVEQRIGEATVEEPSAKVINRPFVPPDLAKLRALRAAEDALLDAALESSDE